LLAEELLEGVTGKVAKLEIARKPAASQSGFMLEELGFRHVDETSKGSEGKVRAVVMPAHDENTVQEPVVDVDVIR
jgi:hypothetical protein